MQLCGGPREHRTDRLSAACRNLAIEEDEAKGYKAFCQHYRMEPTRNKPRAARFHCAGSMRTPSIPSSRSRATAR